MEVKDFLIKLCDSPHVSGYERAAAEIVAGAFGEYLPDVYADKLGNVIGVKKGAGKCRLMFAAHMDEIGLMVADIGERGFVKFTTIGGFDERVFPAREVTIHGKEKVFGVIGVKPPHLTPPDGAKNAFKAEDLCIDTGYSREKLAELIGIGDIITINAETAELKNNFLSGKSMDDCVGVAVLLSVIKHLKYVKHDADVYFVATVQEEVGIRGAATSAYAIEPDVAIAIDCGFAKTPELDEIKTVEPGNGPAIAIGPGIHPGVYELLKKTARAASLKTQVEVIVSRTGTDTDNMQISNTGVATCVISVPVKYMHTPVETVMLDDIDTTGRLLAEFAAAFNETGLEDALCL